MQWLNRVRQSTFIVKLLNWEYWPFGVVHFPLFFYYPVLSLRAGSFSFFSASNPGILMGGMFGESKFDVLRLVPDEFKPKSILIRSGTTFVQLSASLAQHQLLYPLIFKPDIGERGFMVKRINNDADAESYLLEMPYDFIVQELVSLPLEFGVFYERLPSAETGRVTSIVMKEMLFVEGDGESTLSELIFAKERARIQWPVLRERYRDQLNQIIPSGERMEIVSIGNHCLGTKFINANHLIDDELTKSFDKLSKSIPGFYFGRYDLRCASVEDLRRGNVKVMELNGCGAEPAHIYDPSFSFWSAVSVLISHWNTIYKIASENNRAGNAYLPVREALRHYKIFKRRTKV